MSQMLAARFIKFLIILQLVSLLNALLVVKILNVECSVNESYVENASCILKPANRDESLFYLNADLVKPISNVTMRMKLLKKNHANQFQPFMLNAEVNLCDIMDNRVGSRYFLVFKQVIKEHSNLVHSCPYSGHLMVKDANLDTKLLPAAPPLGIYKLSLIFREAITKDCYLKIVLEAEFRDIRGLKY
ncbi:uncharacterized protein LOC128864876 [Anastrepha ludens]|uniref:uncharacterized protein LOC128864876 n=1 Tax=Anastrepha ludens TaxID=28586 RepID=UPI0023B19788|nr:uncharacterized protein LOC128864876 [Anastrepha ludens]